MMRLDLPLALKFRSIRVSGEDTEAYLMPSTCGYVYHELRPFASGRRGSKVRGDTTCCVRLYRDFGSESLEFMEPLEEDAELVLILCLGGHNGSGRSRDDENIKDQFEKELAAAVVHLQPQEVLQDESGNVYIVVPDTEYTRSMLLDGFPDDGVVRTDNADFMMVRTDKFRVRASIVGINKKQEQRLEKMISEHQQQHEKEQEDQQEERKAQDLQQDIQNAQAESPEVHEPHEKLPASTMFKVCYLLAVLMFLFTLAYCIEHYRSKKTQEFLVLQEQEAVVLRRTKWWWRLIAPKWLWRLAQPMWWWRLIQPMWFWSKLVWLWRRLILRPLRGVV